MQLIHNLSMIIIQILLQLDVDWISTANELKCDWQCINEKQNTKTSQQNQNSNPGALGYEVQSDWTLRRVVKGAWNLR